MRDEMTIDELARRAGVTSRNVRAYQERGLLPPPTVRGRVGFYGEGHLARLRHIGELSERGFSLSSIRQLFDAWERGWGLAEILGFEEALAAPWAEESNLVLTQEQLEETFRGGEAATQRAVELGLLAPDPEGGYRVPSPRLLQAGAALLEAGVPLEAMFQEAAALQEDMDRIAGRFVNLFLDHVWQPYVDRGMPPEELPAVTDALQRLRPVAGTAVSQWLAAAMGRRVTDVAAETLSRTPASSGHTPA